MLNVFKFEEFGFSDPFWQMQQDFFFLILQMKRSVIFTKWVRFFTMIVSTCFFQGDNKTGLWIKGYNMTRELTSKGGMCIVSAVREHSGLSPGYDPSSKS